MKSRNYTVALFAICAVQSHAAIVQISNFALGESGSVGASAPFTSLVDSIGGYNIPNWNGSFATKTSIITTGLAAPGSTAAIRITNNDNGGGTYFGGAVGGASGIADNWAMDFWVRPDFNGGTYLGSTDGSATSGAVFWATNTGYGGTSLGGNTIPIGGNYLLITNSAGTGILGSSTSTYTVGTWARVSLIELNGTLNYYLNGTLQDSAANARTLRDVRIGAGHFANAATNAAFDEMKVWTFASTDSLSSIEGIVGVPEPSSMALIGLGGLALVCRRRRA